MVLDGDATLHRTFRDLPLCCGRDDVLVLNETRVIAARLVGRREGAARTARNCCCCIRPARCATIPRAALDRARPPGSAVARRPIASVRRARRGDDSRRARRRNARNRSSPRRSRWKRFSSAPGGCRCLRTFKTIRPRRRSAIRRSSRVFPGASRRRPPRCTLRRSCCARSSDAASRSFGSRSTSGSGRFAPSRSNRSNEHVMHEEAYAIEPESAAARWNGRGGRVAESSRPERRSSAHWKVTFAIVRTHRSGRSRDGPLYHARLSLSASSTR